MIRVIIAGGRDFAPRGPERVQWEFRIGKELRDRQATEEVSGTQRGGDAFGEMIAKRMGIPVKPFAPDYKKFGPKYAPIERNTRMADYADILIALPGGRGTNNMVEQMTERGKLVLDWRDK